MKLNILKKVFSDLGISTNEFDITLNLPMAYKNRYELLGLEVNEKEYVLVKEVRQNSLENFVKQAEYIGDMIGSSYILVFSAISNQNRSLLLKARIPFIDYKGSLFLPQLGIVLNKNLEFFETKKFSPSEQLVFIYLMNQSRKEIVLEEIMDKTKLSKPSIYRVLKRFSNQGWLLSEYGEYIFRKSRKEIFSESQKFLFNPIKKTVYLDSSGREKLDRFKAPIYTIAGTLALAKLSMLAEDREIFAISNKKFNWIVKNEPISYYETSLEGFTELQIWRYEPIKNQNNIVDPISLYLTLKDSTDPRIELELSEVVNEFLEGYEADASKL
ncbi:hypothetical protein [Enterococcus olivae]